MKTRLCLGCIFALAGFLPANAHVRISASTATPVVPVLVGNGPSPVEKLTLISTKSPYTVSRLVIDLSGTTNLNDIQSIGLYGTDAKGNINRDSCIAAMSVSDAKAQTIHSFSATSDSLSLWVAVTLKDSVNLKHRIAARCTDIRTSIGNIRVKSSKPAPLRVGVAVRRRNQDGVFGSRIPGLATSNDGTLLAIFDARRDNRGDLQGNIDIAMHRSFNGGATWQPMQTILDMGTWGGLPEKYNGVSDACILVDKNTGHIYVAGLWMHGALDEDGHWTGCVGKNSSYWKTPKRKLGSRPGTGSGIGLKQTCQFLITKSTDNGNTWSFPVNITPVTKPGHWLLFAPAPGQGITLDNGTLVMPSQGRDTDGSLFSCLTYSTDHGKSWTTTNPAYENTGECNAVQLTNGDIMLNMRYGGNQNNKTQNGRIISTTSDLGISWTEHPTSHNTLTEPSCMASLHRHDITINGKHTGILLFANPDHYKYRRNMTLKASFDDGLTWPQDNWILFDETRGSGYSSITSVNPGTIGILYESGLAELVFIQIDINEIIKQ